jgi:hypothetical protein
LYSFGLDRMENVAQMDPFFLVRLFVAAENFYHAIA